MVNHVGHCPSWAEPFDGAAHALEATAASNTLMRDFRKGSRLLARELAAWMVVSAIEKGWEFDEVTYVPSPPFRSFLRGYTPAKLLADEAALLLSLPSNPYLKRAGGEPSQEHFSLPERARSPCSTFSLTRSPKGKRLLLIDDYQASGATLHHTGLLLKMEEPASLFAITLFQAFH